MDGKHGSICIAPTWDCTYFLKIGFVVLFLSYPPGNKADQERKIVRKKLSFMHIKRCITFLKNMDLLPCGCNSTSTDKHYSLRGLNT